MIRTPRLAAALAASALACGGGDDGSSALRPTLLEPPDRASLRTCLLTDRSGHADQVLDVAGLPEAVAVEGGWRVEVRGQRSDAPFPSPSPCGFTPSQTVALQDAGGARWWVGTFVLSAVAEAPGLDDATPPLDASEGEITLTLRVADTWSRESGVAVSDAGGLLLAVNDGALLLPPEDAGGLATALGQDLPAVYDGACGPYREREVVFTGDTEAASSPGAPAALSLAGVELGVWTVQSVSFAGEVRCTDTWSWVRTLAWRPPAG